MVKIVTISDTHNQHDRIIVPDGDVLVHCGDFTFKGEFFEVRDFVEWFRQQPAKHKIIICGNHEIGLEKKSVHELRSFIFGSGIHYLFNDGIAIEGIKFWGSPMTPRYYDWAFNVDRDKIGKYWDEIPQDTDVLITHGPPFGRLDKNLEGQNCGCYALRDIVPRLPQLKLHVFGHIHEAYGTHYNYDTKLVSANVSVCNRGYDAANAPMVFDI